MPARAQSDCLAESEPNDSAALAQPMMATCLLGTLPPGDQDLAIVEVAEGAPTRWDLSLDGVPGTATLVQLFTVTSEPGAAEPTVDRIPLFELSTTPTSPPAVNATGVLLPAGSYLLGIARSGLLEGGEPETEDYRLRIEAGAPLPPSADKEPNDEPASAQVRTDAFEASGDREGTSSDHVAWEITEPDQHWDVSLQVPLGERAMLDLLDADGRALAAASDDSQVTIYDLALEPGRYALRVREMRDGPSPYVLGTWPSATVADPEPNDETVDATPIADAQPVQGRLATDGDRDRFTLDVTDDEPLLRDLRLLWRSDAERSLCLLGDDDERVVCRRAAGGINLSGLLLEPGTHVFEVSGAADPTDGYVMRVDVTGATAADFETEPNDELSRPNAVDPTLGMRGRGGDRDVDVFRLRTSEAPQVWDVEVSGSAIRELELLRRSGRVLARGEVAVDGSSARLADLHLIPGDHWLRVRSEGPDYSLTTTPLGPPDPDSEREPNDDVAQADRYRVGERAVGRLPTTDDRDFYRFTTAAPQRVRLDLRVPDDAIARARLWASDVVVAELEGQGPGQSLSWDLWLEAGDHYLELAPTTAGEGFYELTSERLDPYAAVVDREPNDSQAWARTVPLSLTWAGDAGDDQDKDWYALPTTVESESLRPARSRACAHRSACQVWHGTSPSHSIEVMTEVSPRHHH